ncbi:MAG: hypothetical protein L6N96_06845 [Candidatus Methylarchaceae archaeon HK02M2]|nr:hypothetical protein [Candidatus Methylarchaceae archaeon HK02M2]
MPIKAAIWVHGNIVEVENPKPSLQIRRWGGGSHFTETSPDRQEYWFHIPIPTPVILDDVRPPLKKIFILYTEKPITWIGSGMVYIDEVNIWDGGSKKEWVWSEEVWPPGATDLFPRELDIDPPITIRHGLGISVHVVFKEISERPDRGIEFNTAGADFAPP